MKDYLDIFTEHINHEGVPFLSSYRFWFGRNLYGQKTICILTIYQ